MSKKVVLHSDLKGKDKSSASANIAARGREKPPSDVGKQLEAVKAHIEDLHVRLINRLLRLAGAARHGYFHLTETRVFFISWDLSSWKLVEQCSTLRVDIHGNSQNCHYYTRGVSQYPHQVNFITRR